MNYLKKYFFLPLFAVILLVAANSPNQEIINSFQTFDRINSVAFSPSGKFAFSGGGFISYRSTELKQWKLNSSIIFRKLSYSELGEEKGSPIKDEKINTYSAKTSLIYPVSKIDCSKYMNLIAAGSGYKLDEMREICFWADSTGLVYRQIFSYRNPMSDFIFLRNENQVATAHVNGDINIWNIEKTKIVKKLKAHNHKVLSLDYSKKDYELMSISKNNELIIWDLKDFSLKEKHKINAEIKQVAINCKSKIFIYSDKKNELYIKNLKEKTLEKITNFSDKIGKITISNCGKYFALVQKHSIELRFCKNGKLLSTLNGHKDKISDIKFSPNSQKLLSGSYDKKLKVWNIKPFLSNTIK